MKGRIRLALAGLVALALAAGGAALTGGASATPPDLLQAAKAAGAKFHSIEQAERAGYELASPCVESPAGGMGFHYGNPELMADDAIDPLRPEILVYAAKPNQYGAERLAGREGGFMGHDAIDRWRATAALVSAAGLDPEGWGKCATCGGSGSIEAYDVSGSFAVRNDGSGEIKADGVGGDLDVRSKGSGGVSYYNVKGSIRLPDDDRRYRRRIR